MPAQYCISNSIQADIHRIANIGYIRAGIPHITTLRKHVDKNDGKLIKYLLFK